MTTRDSTLPTQETTKRATEKPRKIAKAKVRKDWNLDNAIVRVNRAYGKTLKKLAR